MDELARAREIVESGNSLGSKPAIEPSRQDRKMVLKAYAKANGLDFKKVWRTYQKEKLDSAFRF